MADAKKVIRLNYKAYMADADRLYDTTYEQDAKDAGIYNEKVKYQPMAYIVGSKKLFPALDKAISEAKVGEEFTVEIPAEEGAGARNPKLVETHSVKEFYRQEINPYPGLTVSLGNKTGVVLSVGAGRVKVDFNNALAGHDLKYVMTIAEEITDDAEKAKAIIEADFAAADDFKFEFPPRDHQVPPGVARRKVQGRLRPPRDLRCRHRRVRRDLVRSKEGVNNTK